MDAHSVKFASAIAILALLLVMPGAVSAQVAGAQVSGTVTGASGQVVPNAKISLKNMATGQSTPAQSDAAGAMVSIASPISLQEHTRSRFQRMDSAPQLRP